MNLCTTDHSVKAATATTTTTSDLVCEKIFLFSSRNNLKYFLLLQQIVYKQQRSSSQQLQLQQHQQQPPVTPAAAPSSSSSPIVVGKDVDMRPLPPHPAATLRIPPPSPLLHHQTTAPAAFRSPLERSLSLSGREKYQAKLNTASYLFSFFNSRSVCQNAVEETAPPGPTHGGAFLLLVQHWRRAGAAALLLRHQRRGQHDAPGVAPAAQAAAATPAPTASPGGRRQGQPAPAVGPAAAAAAAAATAATAAAGVSRGPQLCSAQAGRGRREETGQNIKTFFFFTQIAFDLVALLFALNKGGKKLLVRHSPAACNRK